MKYYDNRKKRIIFLNHCLLNQSSRGPGVAFRQGPSTELTQILLNNDLSMVQLPCCECMGWGGVARGNFDRYLPMISHSIRFGWFPLLIPIIKASLSSYNRLCRKEAVKVVDRMEDYLQQGYIICGVIGMNDSPTCGVTKTLDMVECIRRLAIAGHEGNPVKQICLDTLIDGESFFMGNLIKEMRKRQLDIKVTGYEPWAESLDIESRRVAEILDLQI